MSLDQQDFDSFWNEGVSRRANIEAAYAAAGSVNSQVKSLSKDYLAYIQRWVDSHAQDPLEVQTQVERWATEATMLLSELIPRLISGQNS